MEINEIKKELYKTKPKATIVHVRKTGILYSANIPSGELTLEGRSKYADVYFTVPLNDIGEGTFLTDIPAQLLIRYLITGDPVF